MKLRLPKNPRQCACFLFLMLVIIVGALAAGQMLGTLIFGTTKSAVRRSNSSSTASVPLPGPHRTRKTREFILDSSNSQRMTGMDDFENERWADIAGNFYSEDFAANFSYATPPDASHGHTGSGVRIRIEPVATTLRGRLEARGLKPNFAYQIKLRGRYADDPRGFENIGYTGRWRLPGRGTNYTDQDYARYEPKEEVEAYVLFDFFVTDPRGNAVREFALDSSLHVLWNAARQGGNVPAAHVWPAIIDARSEKNYVRPKDGVSVELLWTERERVRYKEASNGIRLPPHKYKAELVLTEESFHSKDNDGGFWATVYKCPIEFQILGEGPSPQLDSE